MGNDWLTPKDHANKTGPWRARSKRELRREEILREWVEDPDAADAEIGIHKAGPQGLGGLFDQVLDKLDTAERASMRMLVTKWDEVAGGFASQSSPRNLRQDGTLFVAVANPALAFQLRMQERMFLQRIRELGVHGIRSIRFAPGGATMTEGFE